MSSLSLIPDSHRALIDGPVYAVLSTIMPDGSPQTSVVWMNSDGEHILVNTTRGRRKEKNMKADPRVSILAVDTNKPLHFIEIRGEVVEMTEEGGVEHISELARIYAGAKSYYGDYAPASRQFEETRVICKIKPTRVVTHG